jgi:trehalose 6-phosphate phosphatase
MATRSILTPQEAGVLSAFALSNVLLAFDYDGTLAPIAPTPARARMRSTTRRLLTSVATLYPSVVISGRRLDDIARRVARIPIWHVFGNHGLESTSANPKPTLQTRGWVTHLNTALRDAVGVRVEDKGLTVTVHYRGAPDRAAAIDAIRAALGGLPGARIVGGKEAVNLLPFGAADKGVAIRDALRMFACDTAIYVGDDATDEDAFSAAPHDRLLAIRIGAAARSAALYHVPAQPDIDLLLQRLIDLRGRAHI